jgi:hypothetical protein
MVRQRGNCVNSVPVAGVSGTFSSEAIDHGFGRGEAIGHDPTFKETAMRSRCVLSTLACLLLISSLASAAATVPAEVQEAVEVAPPAALAAAPAADPAAPSPFCAAGLSALRPPAFATAPAPTPLAGFRTCGACSEPYCQGYLIGTSCGGGYSCQNVYGNLCGDTHSECYCWKGPLP